MDWGGQAGPFKRVNVRSHPSAPARWEWGDRCRHSVNRSGRTVQLTAVRETSRNDGTAACKLQKIRALIILQILFDKFYSTDLMFYFTDYNRH